MDRDIDSLQVLVVNGEPMLQEGITELLGKEPGFVVRACRMTPEKQPHMHGGLMPDVAVLVLETHDPAADILLNLLETWPGVKVVVLTAHDDPRLLWSLFSAGANACLAKGTRRDELAAVIRGLREEGDRITISAPRRTITLFGAEGGCGNIVTARELEIVELVSRGLSNSQISSKLFITQSTVKRHLTNIYAKLDVTSRIGAVNRAIQIGILREDSVNGWPEMDDAPGGSS
ncbi:response regulator transcription factor [Nonomuraea diastatica]|nr:response regulator transcription factor [Nonomuraea diastatica]